MSSYVPRMLFRLVLARISYIFPISLVSKLVNGMSNNTRDMVTYLENVVISSSLVNELQTVCHLTFLNWRCDTIKRREVSRETTADNPFFWRVHSFGFCSKRVRPPSLRISIEKINTLLCARTSRKPCGFGCLGRPEATMAGDGRR